MEGNILYLRKLTTNQVEECKKLFPTIDQVAITLTPKVFIDNHNVSSMRTLMFTLINNGELEDYDSTFILHP